MITTSLPAPNTCLASIDGGRGGGGMSGRKYSMQKYTAEGTKKAAGAGQASQCQTVANLNICKTHHAAPNSLIKQRVVAALKPLMKYVYVKYPAHTL